MKITIGNQAAVSGRETNSAASDFIQHIECVLILLFFD